MQDEMKKVCLVGCGNIGRVHARNLAGEVALCFCSRSRQSAEVFLREFDGERVFERFDQVLAASAIDALIICSPPEFHREQIVGALEAGKSVLVEKPMCAAVEEVEQIEKAAAQPDCFLMVAENYYYKPSLALLEALIGEGAIGELQSAFVRKCFTQEATGWKRGYGALLEGGIHFVALISAIFEAAGQQRPERVEGEFPGMQQGEVERHSLTRMEYGGGAAAELHYAWNVGSLTRGTFQHSRIDGAEGRITFESNGIYVRLNARKRKKLFLPGFGDLLGYGRMTRDFLDCLHEKGRQPHSDLDRAKRDLHIIFEAYRSLRP